jgi:hypothetical protein
MDDLSLDEVLEDLSSAEDILDYFGITYDPAVVHVNRLHILQRFHDYIAKAGDLRAAEATRRDLYEVLLNLGEGRVVTPGASFGIITLAQTDMKAGGQHQTSPTAPRLTRSRYSATAPATSPRLTMAAHQNPVAPRAGPSQSVRPRTTPPPRPMPHRQVV